MENKDKKRVTDRAIYIVSGLMALAWIVAAVVLAFPSIPLVFRILVALLPVGVLVYQILQAYRYAQGQDEVQKSILLNGLAIGFSVALPVIFLVGFLMEAGVNMPFKFIDGGYFLEVALLLGYAVAWRRYTA
jgi:hypothetical protein